MACWARNGTTREPTPCRRISQSPLAAPLRQCAPAACGNTRQQLAHRRGTTRQPWLRTFRRRSSPSSSAAPRPTPRPNSDKPESACPTPRAARQSAKESSAVEHSSRRFPRSAGRAATNAAQSATPSPWDTCFSSRQEKLNQARSSGHGAIASPTARSSSSEGNVSKASRSGACDPLAPRQDLDPLTMEADQVAVGAVVVARVFAAVVQRRAVGPQRSRYQYPPARTRPPPSGRSQPNAAAPRSACSAVRPTST